MNNDEFKEKLLKAYDVEVSNNFYIISKTHFDNLMELTFIYQYARGCLYGNCNNCTHYKKEKEKKDKLCKDIVGNLKQCKLCTNKDFIDYQKSHINNALNTLELNCL